MRTYKNLVEAVSKGKAPTPEVEEHTKLGRSFSLLESRKNPQRDLDKLG